MAVFLWVVIGMMQCKNWLVPVALIGVLRPEGPILLAALLIAMKLTYKERVSLSQLLIAVLPTLLWLGLRLSIYGLPLPNTFYAKASSGSVQQMVKGVFYCLPVLLPLLWCWWQWRKEKENMLMVGLGAGTMLLGIVLFGGGDWMFHLRLLQPLLAVLIVISVYYFVKVSNLQRGFLLFLSLPYLLFAVTPSDALKALQLKQLSPEYYQEGLLTHASMELAEEIEQRYEKGSVIAVNHAGALPFALEGFNFIDMVGLNDAHIAKAEGDVHAKYDVGYVLQSKPDLIVLNSRTEPGTDGRYYHKGYWVGEDALVEHPLFNQYYEPANLVRQWHWRMIFPYSLFKKEYTSWIIVYQRKANTAATSRSNTEY
jgi:hypothetical protein